MEEMKIFEYTLDELEERFQKALKDWENSQNKKSWDEMFILVNGACYNILCAYAKRKRLYLRDADEIALDATCLVLDVIKRKGHRPHKLSSFCYLYVIKYLYLPNKQNADKELSLEVLMDEYNDKANNKIGETEWLIKRKI